MLSQDELENRFTYHVPRGDQPERYVNIRLACRQLAVTINQTCPESREKDAAFARLDEVMFHANAAIARRSPK